MSAAKTLSHNTLEKIQQRLSLYEIQGAEGGPYMTLTSPTNSVPVGQVRLLAGNPIQKVVYVGISAPPIQLDSHMLFAFTSADSPVPHFTLDAIQAGPGFAFHLDLIPRVDLGANLEYMQAALHPLTVEFEAVKTIEGLSPAHLSPQQCALMSPWMLAYRANEVAFLQIEKPVNTYLEHWFGLVRQGMSAEPIIGVDSVSLAHRDRLNRQALFNPEVDPVWDKITPLIGLESGVRIREILRNQAVES
ncbi:MAG: hypothetical protein QNJ46_32295 [Leptolyngbyaceae cyanobacterium MO_188.B28]|nr:hypothetical protein [Leptolyngbyaceae cyanobacterium MO_188.B28]